MQSLPSVSGQTILVTGGGGFIGSHLVDALKGENEVRILDTFTNGTTAYVPDDVTVFEGSICDTDVLVPATRGVDLIFHEAAIVDVRASVDEPERTNQTNLDGTLSVLEAARREDAQVVTASSAAIYGDPESLPVAEDHSFDPQSPYGVQKLAADEYTRLYADLYDLETVSLRYFNVYGPRQRGPYSGVIATFLEQALAEQPITVDGEGNQTRDFVHVTDIVRANILAARDGEAGQAYNVGTGTQTSIRELAAIVRDNTATDTQIVTRDPRPGDVEHSVADCSKAATDLGFEATIDLETGIKELIATRTRN